MQTTWTVNEVRAALAAKKISARELAADYYKRIDARNAELNAYLTLSQDRAIAQADRVDALVAAGKPLPPLAGVPLAVQDVISPRGVRTTCGSKILENYIPPYDATAVERLEAAGAVILGKTNCDEFAMGSSNENSAYGPVRNPEAPDRVPGGSSGGSAAGVGGGVAGGVPRHRYGWVDSSARFILRNPCHDAELRPCVALWSDCLCLFA